jgi:hypothetical protein
MCDLRDEGEKDRDKALNPLDRLALTNLDHFSFHSGRAFVNVETPVYSN